MLRLSHSDTAESTTSQDVSLSQETSLSPVQERWNSLPIFWLPQGWLLYSQWTLLSQKLSLFSSGTSSWLQTPPIPTFLEKAVRSLVKKTWLTSDENSFQAWEKNATTIRRYAVITNYKYLSMIALSFLFFFSSCASSHPKNKKTPSIQKNTDLFPELVYPDHWWYSYENLNTLQDEVWNYVEKCTCWELVDTLIIYQSKTNHTESSANNDWNAGFYNQGHIWVNWNLAPIASDILFHEQWHKFWESLDSSHQDHIQVLFENIREAYILDQALLNSILNIRWYNSSEIYNNDFAAYNITELLEYPEEFFAHIFLLQQKYPGLLTKRIHSFDIWSPLNTYVSYIEHLCYLSS